jgi:hypothetical protein
MRTPAPTGGLDWDPGPWLASRETSPPPDPARHFKPKEPGGRAWPLTGEETPEAIGETFVSLADPWPDDPPRVAIRLVERWPNPPKEIAKAAGIAPRSLQWRLSGKGGLDRRDFSRLEE